MTVSQGWGGGHCKGILRQNVVSPDDASKQNTGRWTSLARVGDRGCFGGRGTSKGLVDLDLVIPSVVSGRGGGAQKKFGYHRFVVPPPH